MKDMVSCDSKIKDSLWRSSKPGNLGNNALL